MTNQVLSFVKIWRKLMKQTPCRVGVVVRISPGPILTFAQPVGDAPSSDCTRSGVLREAGVVRVVRATGSLPSPPSLPSPIGCKVDNRADDRAHQSCDNAANHL